MVESYKKRRIPKALRESLWIQTNGRVFDAKCGTPWCINRINAYDFHAGHKVPESKGGPTTLENLIPICARCNLSMGNKYEFQEWSSLSSKPRLCSFISILCCRSGFAVEPTFVNPSSKLSKKPE
jgi:hypothetical protein